MTEKKESKGTLYLYPHLVFEIILITFIVVEAVFILAMALPPPIRRQLDPAFQFAPKPAWYFLPLYELVKYFPGRLIFLGASVLPLLALLLVYAVPWLDRSEETNLRRRPKALLIALLFVTAVLYLLWKGWNS